MDSKEIFVSPALIIVFLLILTCTGIPFSEITIVLSFGLTFKTVTGWGAANSFGKLVSINVGVNLFPLNEPKIAIVVPTFIEDKVGGGVGEIDEITDICGVGELSGFNSSSFDF